MYLNIDLDLVERVNKAVTKTNTIYNRIAPKYRDRANSMNGRIVYFLSSFRWYVVDNLGRVPLSDEKTVFKHSEQMVIENNKAREALRRMAALLSSSRKSEQAGNYAFVMNLIKDIGAHIRQMMKGAE